MGSAARSLRLALGLLLLGTLLRRADACSCSPVHPQQAFCNADVGKDGAPAPPRPAPAPPRVRGRPARTRLAEGAHARALALGPSRILQVDAGIALSFSPSVSLSSLLCRDASQPQNSTEIPLQLQPQKREPGSRSGFGRRRALGCQRGGRGEWGGAQRGMGGVPVPGGLGGWGPTGETFADAMELAFCGLGLSGDGLLCLGLCPQPRLGAPRIKLGQSGSLRPLAKLPWAQRGSGERQVEPQRRLLLCALPRRRERGALRHAGGSLSGLHRVTAFPGHPQKLGALGQVGLCGCLESSRKYVTLMTPCWAMVGGGRGGRRSQ